MAEVVEDHVRTRLVDTTDQLLEVVRTYLK